LENSAPARPRPDARGAGAPYWRAGLEGRLKLPRCAGCGELHGYPRVRCPHCGGTELEWIDASGKGTIHTYTVVRQSGDPYFRAKVPYVLAMIDLAEGVRVMSNVIGCDVAQVRCGDPVQACFEDLGEGVSVPLFRLEERAR
jgi:uncharacterized OB-fold protein